MDEGGEAVYMFPIYGISRPNDTVVASKVTMAETGGNITDSTTVSNNMAKHGTIHADIGHSNVFLTQTDI